MLVFSGKRGKHGSRESCILLENGPTRSLIARASQRSSLAVCKFRTASEEHCGQGYKQCVQALLPDVVAPKTHRNSVSLNCELSSRHAKICMVGSYIEDLRTVKIEGLIQYTAQHHTD